MTETFDAQWWRERLIQARSAMAAAPRTGRALVEIAAQHPLRDGVQPNLEFLERLNRGVEIVQRLLADGWTVEVYVPGSRHRGADGAPDRISLSAAGTEYLRPLLTGAVLLHGEDLNQRYKAQDGVYGSADECFVTAQFYRDGGFEGLHAVVSPQQLPRKMLHYLAFGVEPMLHTAPVANPFHNIIEELFVDIPRVLHTDPSVQGPNSELARRLRTEREVSPGE